MIVKRLDFIDVELEESVKGYLIMAEDEIIDLFHDSSEEIFNWREEYIKPEELIRKENYEF